MQVSQAIKIVNECHLYKKKHGELPVSQYEVINYYRRLAFKTIDDIANPGRKVSFKINNDIVYFDKNQETNLGFF